MRVPVVSKGESWRRKNAKLLREGKEALREFLYFFSPWRKALQLIGGESGTRSAGKSCFFVSFPMCQLVKEDFCPTGNFGGGVQSFFVLLRFLVLLNFFSFLLIAGFVLIPSIIFGSEGTDFTNLTGNILATKLISLRLDSGIGGGLHVTVGLYVFFSLPVPM